MERTNEKGITLIALIITIIVLLILAGISIGMLTGKNAIIDRAEETEYVQAKAELMEKMSLSITENVFEVLVDEGTLISISEVLKIANDNTYINDDEYEIRVLESNTTVPSVGGDSVGLTDEDDNEDGEGVETLIGDVPENCVKAKVIHKKTGAFAILTLVSKKNIVIGDEESWFEPEDEKITIPSSENDIIIYDDTVVLEDADGNEVTIPGGFGVSNESGDNITDGIVIEDSLRNQFVWIPVGEELIKRNKDGTKETVVNKLGRYVSWEIDAEPLGIGESAVVYGSTFGTVEETKDNPLELGNVIATDIEAFIEETNQNGGFYLGRYEAGVKNEYGKITTYRENSVSSFTQEEAANDAKDMYSESEFVESDLTNSFAFDTAVMYIQKFSHEDDAETYYKKTGYYTQGDDEYCKIIDLASGEYEWNTETSLSTTGGGSPAVNRGGTYINSAWQTAWRTARTTTYWHARLGSRPILVSISGVK